MPGLHDLSYVHKRRIGIMLICSPCLLITLGCVFPNTYLEYAIRTVFML
jgi:hypothetical protein